MSNAAELEAKARQGSMVNMLLVGVGQRFRSLAEAFAYIDSRPSMTLVDTGSITCSTIQGSKHVQCSGNVANIRGGDLLYVTNDVIPLFDGFGVGERYAHYYPIMQTPFAGGGTKIVLASAVHGLSQGPIPLVVFRPVRYKIIILDREIELANENDPGGKIPNGASIDIDFAGCSVWEGGGDFLPLPEYGYIAISNAEARCRLIDGGQRFIWPAEGDGSAFMRLVNIEWNFGNALQINSGSSLAGVEAIDLYVHGGGDHGIRFCADYMRINNLSTESYAEEALHLFGLAYTPEAHLKKLANINIHHSFVSEVGTGAINLGGYSIATSRFEINGLSFLDDGGFSTNHAIKASLCDLTLRNALIDYSADPYGSLVVADNAIVRLHNSRRNDGSAITLSTLNGGRVIKHDPDASQSIAYAASVTPDCDLGSRITVGTLTGNLTIAAPANPRINQEISFLFTQDGTGGRTITWNAVFKKAADGAGTANKKAASLFRYDGTNWVQVGSALSWS